MTNLIRQRRTACGMSITGLATASGVSRRTIINAEQGHHRPHPSTLRLIAQALGVSADDLKEAEAAPIPTPGDHRDGPSHGSVPDDHGHPHLPA